MGAFCMCLPDADTSTLGSRTRDQAVYTTCITTCLPRLYNRFTPTSPLIPPAAHMVYTRHVPYQPLPSPFLASLELVPVSWDKGVVGVVGWFEGGTHRS